MEQNGEKLKHICMQLSEDAKDFWQPRRVQRLAEPPSAWNFYRHYVSKNIPVIIQNAMHHWPAMEKWQQLEDIAKELKPNTIVTVDITPTGKGDAVVGDVYQDEDKELFIKPEERNMTFDKFIHILRDNELDGIPYLSHQVSIMYLNYNKLYLIVGRIE